MIKAAIWLGVAVLSFGLGAGIAQIITILLSLRF